jgi:hypothetical protein
MSTGGGGDSLEGHGGDILPALVDGILDFVCQASNLVVLDQNLLEVVCHE